jgi:peptidoglycan/xylan/chitin deacetylase (PgdA/CDA1 family)
MKNVFYGLVLLAPLACAQSVKQSNSGNDTGGAGGDSNSSSSSTDPSNSGGITNTAGSGGTSSTSPRTTANGGSGGTGGALASGGTVTVGASTNFEMSDCGLPIASAGGVTRPSGTPGNFKVLNWAGFKGAVSYTFDDANQSQIDNYAALQALGVPMTFYLQTGKSSAQDPIWKQALLDGHELGNHTKNHTHDNTTDPTINAADVDAATTFIQSQFGVKPYTMAAPYGDPGYATLAESRFLINRGVNNAVIVPNGTTNPFNLPCFIPATGAKSTVFNAQTDSALTSGGWRVVLVHGFENGGDGAYQPINIDEFTTHVRYAKSLRTLWLDSVVNVGAYWRAQKLLSTVTPTQSGSENTWTWTLPNNFPPGKCLRATVDGGTLLQGGKALTWNEHGFYEIALDAGSVTLAP